MPRVRQNPGEKLDCSKRSVTPFQIYVNHLITRKPEKIKALLARALMNDDSLMDFNGQINANECVFSYPDSNWYSVYLMKNNGEMYWGTTGARKFYFQMDFRLDGEGVPIDAFPINGTLETPDELMVNGSEMKNCVIKENGKCGNPESKKKKKKSGAVQEDYEEQETPEQILQNVSQVSLVSGPKQKMPRDYFENLGSKSLIIDWMIANMKPNEIFKCIQSGSLSAEDLQQAESLLTTIPSSSSNQASGVSQAEINSVINSFSPGEISNMVKVITREELVGAVSRIKDPERRKESIITLCKRAGLKKYSIRKNAKGKNIILDEDGEQVDDINEVLDECAKREAYRLKKMLKIKSISQDVKKGLLSRQDLIGYRGGIVRLPYTLMASVKRHFPLIRKYENQDGYLFASIPGGRDDDGTLFYYKVDDILGRDLKKLDKLMESGEVSFGKRVSFGKKTSKKSRIISLKQLLSDLKNIKKL